jgi:hypothetical protein
VATISAASSFNACLKAIPGPTYAFPHFRLVISFFLPADAGVKLVDVMHNPFFHFISPLFGLMV